LIFSYVADYVADELQNFTGNTNQSNGVLTVFVGGGGGRSDPAGWT